MLQYHFFNTPNYYHHQCELLPTKSRRGEINFSKWEAEWGKAFKKHLSQPTKRQTPITLTEVVAPKIIEGGGQIL
jgi:hypothetical protein